MGVDWENDPKIETVGICGTDSNVRKDSNRGEGCQLLQRFMTRCVGGEKLCSSDGHSTGFIAVCKELVEYLSE